MGALSGQERLRRGDNMTDPRFWIWLQEALGIGSHKVDRVLRQFGSPEPLYQMDQEALLDTGIFTPKEAANLRLVTLEHAQKQVELAKRYGCRILTPDQAEFPENLTNMDGIPCVLYVLGDLSKLADRPSLCLVGTRRATSYGERTARDLSRELAAAGCAVVSGLAVGIDSAAHEGALEVEGYTIGLLACGMNVNYPMASAQLKRRILDGGGALVTEFPFGFHSSRYAFYTRNRLLSGISSGVVVIQAPESSGALITARYALDQSRDVFAVPGEMGDESMKGCNRLIADGAVLVQNAESILAEYRSRFPGLKQPGRREKWSIPADHLEQKRPKRALPAAKTVETSMLQVAQEAPNPTTHQKPAQLEEIALTQTAKALYYTLEAAPLDCDQLVERTGLAVSEIMSALTELELNDLAEILPGGRFRIKA